MNWNVVRKVKFDVFSHVVLEIAKEIDYKFMLHNLYKNNAAAKKVFPTTYGSIQEALDDTAEASDNGLFFFVKPSGTTRGEGIEIIHRNEIVAMLEQEGDYKLGSVVIQETVKDLLTVDIGL